MKRFLLCFLLLVLQYLGFTLIDSTAPCSDAGQVIEAVKSIVNAQVLYSITKGKGRSSELAHLAELGFIDQELASGEKYEYLFESRPVGGDGLMFDVIATPKNQGGPCAGTRSFYTNETMVVYEVEGINPPTATREDRVPRIGRPLE